MFLTLYIVISRLTEELDGDDSSLPKPKPSKKKTRKAPVDISSEIENAIRQSSELNEQVRKKIAGPQDSRSVERQNWGQWMTSILPTIDDRLWNRYMRCYDYFFFTVYFVTRKDILDPFSLQFHTMYNFFRASNFIYL